MNELKRHTGTSFSSQLTLFQWLVGFFFIELMWTFAGGWLTYEVQTLFNRFSLGSTVLSAYISGNLNFLVLFGALLIFIRFGVGSSLQRYVTDAPAFRYRLFFQAFGIWSALLLLFSLAIWVGDPQRIVFVPPSDLSERLLFFLLVFILTPLQSISEELLFRSTLWRMLSGRLKKRWLICLISAVAFALAHLNSALGNWPVLLYYVLSGFLFMSLTIQSKGSELVFGAHVANNLFVAIVLNYGGSPLVSDSLFYQQTPILLVDYAILLLFFVMNIVAVKQGEKGE